MHGTSNQLTEESLSTDQKPSPEIILNTFTTIKLPSRPQRTYPLNPRHATCKPLLLNYASLPSSTKRKVPFYKFLHGTQLTVDAFSFGKIPNCDGYFLTHFHADHYGGLTKGFDHGPIYGSKITLELVKLQIKADERFLVVLPMNEPKLINGVTVTLIDANQSDFEQLMLFLFEYTIKDRLIRTLHTGDFRASIDHLALPSISSVQLDIIYLDSTYLAPSHTFPPQHKVISSAASLLKSIVVDGRDPRETLNATTQLKNGKAVTYKNEYSQMASWLKSKLPSFVGQSPTSKRGNVLILVGSYTIGKEKIYTEIAKAIDSLVYVESQKLRILHCLGDTEIDALITRDAAAARVHVVPMGHLNHENIIKKLISVKGIEYSKIITVRPTVKSCHSCLNKEGWTWKPKPGLDPSDFTPRHIKASYSTLKSPYAMKPASIFSRTADPKAGLQKQIEVVSLEIPYSEHSSFSELEMFMKGMDVFCPRVVFTVNVGNEMKRAEMEGWISRWRDEHLLLVETNV